MSEIKVNSIKGVGASTAAISVDNSNGTCTANIINNLSNRRVNKNGSFLISQKNGDTEVTLGSSGDRWIDLIHIFLHNSATFKAQRVSDAPTGFQYSAKHTVHSADSSVSNTDEAMFIHRVEGFDTAKFAYGTSSAKQITVSFYVKSSLTGDFSFAAQTGGRNYVNEYTINSANTWERKSFTLPVLTDGTHNTTNGTGLSFIWDLGSGDTYATSTLGSWVTASNLYRSTGSTRLSINANATWQITGIQVEEGTVMTDFEHFPVGHELALCQRYFETGNGLLLAAYAGGNFGGGLTLNEFAVTKRAIPTITLTQLSGQGGSNADQLNTNTTYNVGVHWGGSAGQGNFRAFTFTANAEL
tara:strand:+ start:35 stop:1105 length:1071 start_codon:yes stop_codon:yes gene_type:complete